VLRNAFELAFASSGADYDKYVVKHSANQDVMKIHKILLASFFLIAISSISLATVQQPKRVFVLNSFNRGYTWTDNMLRGIDDTFTKSGLNIETYVTFMDMKRVPATPQYFSQLKELIRAGYGSVSFDAVLACDNDAFEFTKKYRDELFPGIPVVFSSINDFDQRMLDGRKDITGTSENTDYAGTIRCALKLRPSTTNIVVVVDATTTGRAHRSAVEKLHHEFPQEVTFTYLSLADFTLDELARKLSGLERGSIVLLLQHFVDRTGTSHPVKQSTSLLTQSSAVPVFVTTDIRMGFGALGGHLVSGYHHGADAAEMILRILNGADIRSIPVLLDAPNKYVFDYSVMKRFGIRERNLPNGSILINKPVSAMALYKRELFIAAVVYFILCAAIVIVLMEIRRRRKVEQTLRASEERYRTLFDKAGEGVILMCMEGKLLAVNDSFARMHGYSAGEMLNRNLIEFDTPGSFQHFPERMARLQTGETVTFEVEHYHRDGHVFPLEVSATMVVSGGQTYIQCFHRDITAQRRAREALVRGEAKYRRLFSEMNMGCALHEIMCDEAGKPVDYVTLDVNDAFERILKLKRAEVIGKRASTILPAEELSRWVAIFGPVALTGISSSFEVYSATNQRYFEGNAYCPESGKFAATFSDVTERRQSLEEKEQLQKELAQAQKMESIGRLAGGVAHDFNNMLTGIIGNAELCRDDLSSYHPLRQRLDEIVAEAQRSAELTRQLLAFARKQTIIPRIVDLNDSLENMLKLLRRTIGEHIEVAFLPGEGLWPVWIDPSQVDQILANLCVNAKDAITGAGKVIILTGNVTIDKPSGAGRTAAAPGEYVFLSVSDNGCGMTKDVCDHIFEPFFSTKGIGKGTGLGLATVYGIVEQNKGFVSVLSAPGEGSTFSVHLPRSSATDHGAAVARAKTDRPGGTETILLVEDEESVRVTTRICLEGLGYTVLVADGPEKALHMTMQYSGVIHLLITDMIMPIMNGRVLARRLNEIRPKIKCLFISGFSADIMEEEGFPNGDFNFLPKPFSRDSLARKVRDVIDG